MSAANMNRMEAKKHSKKDRQELSAKLRTAAQIVLRDEGRSIIEGLAESCRDGDVASARLLFELAQGGEEVEEDFRSLAFGLDRN
jgi:hypothetical protein